MRRPSQKFWRVILIIAIAVVVILGWRTGAYPKGFFWESLLVVAAIQALFWIPAIIVAGVCMVARKLRMKDVLHRMEETAARRLREVMRLEDDHARAQELAGMLQESADGQVKTDILEYVRNYVAGEVGAISLQKVDEKALEAMECRQTMLVVSMKDGTLPVARGKDGTRYVLCLPWVDMQVKACPLEDREDGNVLLEKPAWIQSSDLDMESMEQVSVKDFLQVLQTKPEPETGRG